MTTKKKTEYVVGYAQGRTHVHMCNIQFTSEADHVNLMTLKSAVHCFYALTAVIYILKFFFKKISCMASSVEANFDLKSYDLIDLKLNSVTSSL